MRPTGDGSGGDETLELPKFSVSTKAPYETAFTNLLPTEIDRTKNAQ